MEQTVTEVALLSHSRNLARNAYRGPCYSRVIKLAVKATDLKCYATISLLVHGLVVFDQSFSENTFNIICNRLIVLSIHRKDIFTAQ